MHHSSLPSPNCQNKIFKHSRFSVAWGNQKEREKKKDYVNVLPNTLTERGGPLVCLPIQRRSEGAGSLTIFFGPLSGCLLGHRLQRTAAEALPVPGISMRWPGLLPGLSPVGRSPTAHGHCARPALQEQLSSSAWPTLHSLATTPGQRCTARLLCAWHGPEVGSRSLNQLIQGTTNQFPALLPREQWDGCGVRGQD